MCGIAGFITRDGKGPSCKKEGIEEMFKLLAIRGTDASGIFWDSPKYKGLFKAPVSTKELNPFIPWEEVLKSNVCLLHSRAATQGDPKENDNNHPLKDGDLVVTHNGCVFNSDSFVKNNVVDSYAIIEAYKQQREADHAFSWNMRKTLKSLQGSLTFAAYNETVKRLLLVKKGNPLVVGFKGNTIFYASTSTIMNPIEPDVIWAVKDYYLLSIKAEEDVKGYQIKVKEYTRKPLETGYYFGSGYRTYHQNTKDGTKKKKKKKKKGKTQKQSTFDINWRNQAKKAKFEKPKKTKAEILAMLPESAKTTFLTNKEIVLTSWKE